MGYLFGIKQDFSSDRVRAACEQTQPKENNLVYTQERCRDAGTREGYGKRGDFVASCANAVGIKGTEGIRFLLKLPTPVQFHHRGGLFFVSTAIRGGLYPWMECCLKMKKCGLPTTDSSGKCATDKLNEQTSEQQRG